jgi:hypothetical protein
MTAHALPRPRRKIRTARGLLMAPVAFLAALLIGAGIFIWSALWPTWPSGPVFLDAPAIPITVANVLFDVPPRAIRAAVQRRAGPHERIDLTFLWPSLAPPQGKDSDQIADVRGEAAPTTGDLSQRLFVTIAALGPVLPPAERLRSVYPHYAEAQATDGPDGLAILPFRAGTPYQGEDLVYLAANPEQFFARCTRQAGKLSGTCLHERLIDTAAITVRFPRAFLDDWRGAAAGIDRLIAQLHPPRN